MWLDMVSVGSGGPIGPNYIGVLVGDMVLEGALRGQQAYGQNLGVMVGNLGVPFLGVPPSKLRCTPLFFPKTRIFGPSLSPPKIAPLPPIFNLHEPETSRHGHILRNQLLVTTQ